MLTINREELKAEFPKLIELIQKHHVMEDKIERELFINNKPVKGLCHTRGYFMVMDEYFIQYEMDHIIVDPNINLIGRSLREVIVYEDYQEYESARLKAMTGTKDQTG